MKKVWLLLIALAFAVMLFSCGNETENMSARSENDSKDVSSQSIDSDSGEKSLSDWVDDLPDGKSAALTRNLYRYRDCVRETKEDDVAKLSGWTQYDSRTEPGDWSAWSDSEFTPSKNREVETQQTSEQGQVQYRYGRWYNSESGKYSWCKEYSQSLHGGDSYIQYSDWCDSELEKTGVMKTCGSSDSLHPNHVGVSRYDESAWWNEYIDSYGDKWYWVADIKGDSTIIKTQYRYRDIKTIYCYERYVPGNSEWSEWSETPFSDNDGKREVESKKQYRYEY